MLRQSGLFLDENNPLYDSLVPKDHILRQIKELVDFSFVYEELKVKYCNDNGRNAVNPILLFKYLLLKAIYCVSDVDVVKRSLYDLSFKYFLNLDPQETNLIDPSLLTVFRRKRLEDDNLLDLLIGKTVEIAASHGLLKTKAIIVDSTHTNSRYNSRSPEKHLSNKQND